jgi:hypothetical protein
MSKCSFEPRMLSPELGSGYPHKPLVSYRINRQLSGWIPPPLMIRAFGAHCHFRTHAVQQGSGVAVGTGVSPRAPRTDPDVQLSRIRLPPRVCDGKAIARPGMKDARFWEPVVRQLRHSCPREPILLAATPQRTPPKIGDMVPERVQSTRLVGTAWKLK